MNRPAANDSSPVSASSDSPLRQAGLVHCSPNDCLLRQHRGRPRRHVAAPPMNAAQVADRDHNRRPHLQHPPRDQLVAGRGVALLECQQVPIDVRGRRRQTSAAATAANSPGDWRPARGPSAAPRRTKRPAARTRDRPRSRQSRGPRPIARARAARLRRRQSCPVRRRRRRAPPAARIGPRYGIAKSRATTKPKPSATARASTGGSLTPASQSTSAAQASSAAANSSSGISESMVELRPINGRLYCI